MRAATSTTAAGTRTFQSVFLPATATSVTFTVADDDEGVTPGAEPDVGPGCGAATCELLSRTTATVPELATATRPVSVSRFSRNNSERMSEACWYRSSRSFSSARLMMSSSLGGRSGFNRNGGSGARFMMPSKMMPELSPRNGKVPVAISYSTTPKENRSVRASSSLARTCSGDI